MHRAALAIVVGLALCGGCGRPATSAAVRGRVTVGNEPLPGGLIRFHAADSATRWSGATIEADGSYIVPDVPLGRCTVTVDTSNLKNLPARTPPRPDAPVPPGTPDPSAPRPAYRPIAAKYATASTSPLVVDVKPGKNDVDLQVD